jgi:hypothetical protein
MNQEKNLIAIPDEIIMQKIYLIRGKNVMLDKDLAELYNVETKQLKRAVRRNIIRFPEDFMFELSQKEFNDLRSQFGTSSWGGTRYPPMAFTEHGVLMLSSVLNSERAIKVNIQVMRIYTKIRQMLLTHKEILNRLDKIEQKLADHDNQILIIFEYLKQLEQTKQIELERKPKVIKGYRKKGKDQDT